MYSYSFDKQSKILKVDFFDVMTMEDVIKYFDELKTLSFLPDNLRVIYDLTDADVQINPQEVKKIAQLTHDVTADYISVKSAFLVDTPMQAALTLIFSRSTAPPKTRRKVFSTLEAASAWLKE